MSSNHLVEPVEVPGDVYRMILAIRDIGVTNMLDVKAVERIAKVMSPTTADWIRRDRTRYAQLIFAGRAEASAA